MKHNPTRILLPVLTLAALALASCGPSSAKASSINQLAPEVNTAVAATLTAMPTNTAVPTSTPTLTPTPTATPTATATAFPTSTPIIVYSYPTPETACYASAYISDVTIPDYSQVAPGEVFRKTWLLENTGTCAWDATYRMDFVGGYDMAGSPKKIGQTIYPGQDAYLTVDFTAPDTAGEYTSYWRLGTKGGALFGVSVYVVIDVPYDLVVAPTPTSLPTNTPVPTATATLTPTPLPPTNTPEPTPTPTLVPPTNTPTPTPAPTFTPTPTPVPTEVHHRRPTPVPTPTDEHHRH
jgi:Ig-like domain from next to BRCA1 gene